MAEPKNYLIYEWYGADERDWSIVGPFRSDEDADIFFHEFGRTNEWGGPLPGWNSMGWEHVGTITGHAQGRPVDSPMLMVDTHPRTAEDMQASLDRVAFLVGLGFEPTDAVLQMKLPTQKEPSIFNAAARGAHNAMWQRHMDEQLGKAGFFFSLVAKDRPITLAPESGEDQRR